MCAGLPHVVRMPALVTWLSMGYYRDFTYNLSKYIDTSLSIWVILSFKRQIISAV